MMVKKAVCKTMDGSFDRAMHARETNHTKSNVYFTKNKMLSLL